MSSYIIKQWNQTIDSSNVLRPIFTFEPDNDFLNYIYTNPGPIQVMIQGTDYYDGPQYATCISSADFPTFGPNYFQVTNDYVMVLHTEFTLYPKNMGTMTILYNVRIDMGNCAYRTLTTEHYEMSPKTTSTEDDDSTVVRTTNWYLIIAVVTLLTLILVICGVYKMYVL